MPAEVPAVCVHAALSGADSGKVGLVALVPVCRAGAEFPAVLVGAALSGADPGLGIAGAAARALARRISEAGAALPAVLVIPALALGASQGPPEPVGEILLNCMEYVGIVPRSC